VEQPQTQKTHQAPPLAEHEALVETYAFALGMMIG
jgi:hypothetical protein